MMVVEPVYPQHLGRNNTSHADWTPQSAVSSFNLPLGCDSALNTPVQGSVHTPMDQQRAQSASHDSWMKHQQQMNYSSRSYPNPETSIKGKDVSLSLQVTDAEIEMNMAHYVWNSPQPRTSEPPTPYWGSYTVSAAGPPELSSTETTPNTNSSPQVNTPSSTYSSAPILSAPSPAQLGRSLKASAKSTPSHTQAQYESHAAFAGQHYQQQAPSHVQGYYQAQAQLPIHTTQADQHTPQPRTLYPKLEQGGQLSHSRGQHASLAPSYDGLPHIQTQLAPNSLKRESPPLPQQTSKRRRSYGGLSAGASAHPDRRSVQPTSLSAVSSNATRMQWPVSAPAPYDPSPEDRILFALRDDTKGQKPLWKETAAKYAEQTGQTMKIAALQMRYSRAKEKMRVWTENDINALLAARDNYKRNKWETISKDMMSEGCLKKWSPRACQSMYMQLFPTDWQAEPSPPADEYLPLGNRDEEAEAEAESDAHHRNSSGADGAAADTDLDAEGEVDDAPPPRVKRESVGLAPGQLDHEGHARERTATPVARGGGTKGPLRSASGRGNAAAGGAGTTSTGRQTMANSARQNSNSSVASAPAGLDKAQQWKMRL